MIERVVVPVDFTSESDRALLVAPWLASRAGAPIELITVAEPISRTRVEERLGALAERTGEGATSRVIESGGPPEAALLTQLHRDEKALWCVGSHARGAWSELLFQSVSEDLVRDAHVPVILVGPHVVEAPAGQVLAVALDGSEQSEVIVAPAADLATALGMAPRLIQVADDGAADLPSDAVETGYLARVAEKWPSLEHRLADYDVLHGRHPARDIADYVGAHRDVGMVALATRGLAGSARVLQGSTAFDLAHRAPVPVLILHHV